MINLQNSIHIESMTLSAGTSTAELLLSKTGLMIYNNPLSYIKLGYTTQDVAVFNIRADDLVVKNLTILDALYTDIMIYGTSLIAGTTGNIFTINSNGTGNSSTLLMKTGSESLVLLTANNNNSITFGNGGTNSVKLSGCLWNGDLIGITKGGTGLTEIADRQLIVGSGTNTTVVRTLTNITNQVSVDTATTGQIKFTLPQDIATTSNVLFETINALLALNKSSGTNTLKNNTEITGSLKVGLINNHTKILNNKIIVGNNLTIIDGADINCSTADITEQLLCNNLILYSLRLLKDNITLLDYNSLIKKLLQLQPIKHTFKKDLNKVVHYGLIALDVLKISPELVGYNSTNKLVGVHYQRLTIPLLCVVKQHLHKLNLYNLLIHTFCLGYIDQKLIINQLQCRILYLLLNFFVKMYRRVVKLYNKLFKRV